MQMKYTFKLNVSPTLHLLVLTLWGHLNWENRERYTNVRWTLQSQNKKIPSPKNWYNTTCFLEETTTTTTTWGCGEGTFKVAFTRSSVCFRFGEGAQLFGVDVPQLLQLPLGPTEQILDVHDVLLLDPGVLPELVSDAGDEAWFVPSRLEELAIQGQNLLLHFTVSGHEWFTVAFGLTAEQTNHDDDEDHPSPCLL